MELFRPLATAHFLPFVLRRLGLTDSGRQKHLFRKFAAIAGERHRVSSEAYRRLLRDPRFRELRERRLLAALTLDPVLCGMTLASRRSLNDRIASGHYSLVWRHDRALRAMARECPGLLPLAVTVPDEGRILNEDLRVEVSDRIREEYENGRAYYKYRGKPLSMVPGTSDERPGTEFLRWRNEVKFLG